MKIRSAMIGLLLVLLTALCLTGCDKSPGQETTAPETDTYTVEPTPIAGDTLYRQAANRASALQNLTLTITTQKTTVVGGESFSEERSQTLAYSGLGTGDFAATMEGTVTIGSQTIAVSELFSKKNVYFTVNDVCISGQMTAGEFCNRYAPVVPLDASLYGSILAEPDDSGMRLSFTEPKGAESWVIPEEAALISANGSALLDTSGTLLQSTYDITYSYGPAVIRQTVTVDLHTDTPPQISAPSDPSNYIPLAYPDAPMMLEIANGYLLQAASVSAVATDTIVSQAGGIGRTQVVRLNMYGSGAEQMSDVDTSVSLVDYGRKEETTTYHQTEHFQNDQYTIRVDGGDAAAVSTVTAPLMRNYCQTLLVGSILLSECVERAKMSELDSIYLLELTAGEDMAQMLCRSACQTLFGNENFLTDLSSDYATDRLECYLAIDKYTGFPTAAGISYSGTHIIDETPYLLTAQQDQSYTLASLTAYESITGQPPADTQTSAEPTPLLYRVTGEDGKQLWLFGTVSVGDGSTSRLPGYICDAFDSADALAVELDAGSFLAQAETNAELQVLIDGICYYQNGTAADHLEPALCEKAFLYLKASGSNDESAALLKPVFLEMAIADFYIRQGYHLTATDSASNRLLERATTAGKQILETASDAQLKALAKLSDDVGQMLLEQTLTEGAADYAASVEALYALWCGGDEAALREMLEAEPSGLSEEEQALYEQYRKAMLTDRNAAMAKTAKAYLESGDAVFYAVGLSHLFGESGLISSLRDAGFTVEPVTGE